MRFSHAFSKLSIACIATMMASSGACASDHREYPISSHVCTTLERTVIPNPVPSGAPAIFPSELSKYTSYGYGQWHYGPGVASEKRFDIMSSSYTGAGVTPRAELLNFFSISDMHIRDKESPAQAIYWGYTGLVPQPMAYSGTMLYTTQILDAAIQTINALHKHTPFDFGISLGDACHSTQYNELRWFIDVLDGKVIIPSSGAHVGAHSIDYQRPYKAAGLNNIPWYVVMGNGDRFWQGFLTPNSYLRHRLLGRKILNLGNPFMTPDGANTRGYYMGVIDGKTPYGTVIGVGPQAGFNHSPKIVAADKKRRSLSKRAWAREFFKSSSSPKGHGCTKASKERGFACYTFEPTSKLPIRFIVLDDLENRDTPTNPQNIGQNHGFLDAKRYRWLVHELDKGQTQGKLMIVAAHVPIGVEPPIPTAGWLDPVFEANVVAKLHTYPNLLMWMCGHYHRNNVTAIPSPDPSYPELGFWVVETASLLQFPQQFRTFRIVRNSDNTLSLFVTNVDPAVTRTSPAAKSRLYAIGAMQIFKSPVPNPPSGAYNAELFKQLTQKMQKKIQKYGTAISE
jgi:metallophosphoesterase (TIGR03768 family)